MIHWDLATVKECIRSRNGLQEVAVELQNGSKARAVHYTDVLPPVQEGDQVILNTTAVELSLGTGGFHFVYNVVSGDNEKNAVGTLQPKGHMMKLRYTPLQRSVLAAEEENSPYHSIFKEPKSLQRMPVLIGELHSMLPIAMCWLNYLKTDSAHPKIVYIMSDGGALPLAFSIHAGSLRDMGWLAGTITYGQAYGGDLETMNKFTALIAAKHIFQADLAIVLMGPGIAGTGTMMGHTGVEVGELINAVSILHGTPIIIPRISFAEDRKRHRGLSHHTLTSLNSIALKPVVFPLPIAIANDKKFILQQQIQQSGCDQKHDVTWVSSIDVDDIQQSQRSYPHKITTMGRGLSEDPDFFLGVCSAAQTAWEHCLSES